MRNTEKTQKQHRKVNGEYIMFDKTTYWKRESLNDGSIIALFKIETANGIRTGYIYKKGKWEEYDPIISKAGYDDDYDCISEEEAKEIMKQF